MVFMQGAKEQLIEHTKNTTHFSQILKYNFLFHAVKSLGKYDFYSNPMGNKVASSSQLLSFHFKFGISDCELNKNISCSKNKHQLCRIIATTYGYSSNICFLSIYYLAKKKNPFNKNMQPNFALSYRLVS